MNGEHTGACLCGSVRFTTRGKLDGVIYCHCSQCRKQTGHFYAATSIAADALSVEGEDRVTWYAASPDARRGFCSVCGSALFWRDLASDQISILAGAFDKPSGLKGTRHIYVADKGDYYEIEDGLPRDDAWAEQQRG
ncbi:MAG: GFA family protein [Rhizobiaceae bacterium]|nr:GFA family protein [Rhizobiaceae bacterium]